MVLHLQQQQQLHFHGGVSTSLNPRYLKPLNFCGGSSALFLTTTIPSNISSLQVELDSSSPPPLGLQKFLNLESGEIYYKKIKKEMSRNGNGKMPKLDLRLNLSPPRPIQEEVESPPTTPKANSSPLSSCISSENNDLSSPETTSMILAGCPCCLMYVMLPEDDPKCPKCKSTVLLDFLHDHNNIKKTSKN